MISLSSLHHKSNEGSKIVRSHKLAPHDTVTLFCIIEGEKENIISILEDHLLEMISWVEWQMHDIESDFSYVAEHFNHFIKNLEPNDLVWVSILFASIINSTLTLSVIGHAQALLIEKNWEATLISTEDLWRYEFHSISSGAIPQGGNIYLSNAPISAILGNDILVEFSELDDQTWIKTAEGVLMREYHDNLHIIRISQEHPKPIRKPTSSWQLHLLNQKGSLLVSKLLENLSLSGLKLWTPEHLPHHNKTFQYGFLFVGVILLFFLAYSLMSAISGIIHTTSSDSKSQLLQAQSLIEQSQKLTSNPISFNKNIKEAEKILFALRDKKEHIADTQDLLGRIEAMKKEVNDVQTVDMSKYTSLMQFNSSDISPIGVFEKNKKLTLIGRNGVIMDYAREWPLPKVSPYPPWEEAVAYDVADDGNFFILTNNSRILSPRREELTYVTVTGQDGWDKAQSIKTFNGNIYLVSTDGRQILRHKPGMNGFSPKTTMLENTNSWVLDIGIDGGLYILLQDGKLQRYISWKDTPLTGITINKVPGEYDIGQFSPTRLFVRPNLAYIYILSGNRIWIFQPDSKRFQDITSLTYVAQLEIQTQEEVRNIYVPRDGTVDIVTNLWIYEVWFEIADGKIILR
jgi:hypothetical protein